MNPFDKAVMQHPAIRTALYKNLPKLKDAFLRYGASRDGFMALVYALRICDKRLTEFHISAMFALAKKYVKDGKVLKILGKVIGYLISISKNRFFRNAAFV